MEYAPGGNLADYVAKRRGLPEPEARRVFAQVVEGVGYLHGKNIAHRDLKPDNIFIHNGVYMIADFGFARFYKPKQLMNSFVGTPLYESP